MFWQTFVFIQAYKACLNLARFLLNLGSYSFTLLLPCSAVRILASSCWCVTHRLYQARNKLDLVWGHSVLTTRSEYMENKLGWADLSLAVVCCQVWKAVCAASIAACRSADGENDEFWTFFCQTWVSSVDMSGTEQRTWIQKSHSDRYAFHLFCKTLQWYSTVSSPLQWLGWSPRSSDLILPLPTLHLKYLTFNSTPFPISLSLFGKYYSFNATHFPLM